VADVVVSYIVNSGVRGGPFGSVMQVHATDKLVRLGLAITRDTRQKLSTNFHARAP
jgi:hypothetical protein